MHSTIDILRAYGLEHNAILRLFFNTLRTPYAIGPLSPRSLRRLSEVRGGCASASPFLGRSVDDLRTGSWQSSMLSTNKRRPYRVNRWGLRTDVDTDVISARTRRNPIRLLPEAITAAATSVARTPDQQRCKVPEVDGS